MEELTKESQAKTSKAKKTAAKESATSSILVKQLVGYKEKGSYLFDFSQNLGEGGVFVQTDALKEQGEAVHLSISLADSKKKIAVKGRVIWVQQPVAEHQGLIPGIGVQLESLSSEDWFTLANHTPTKTKTA